MGNLYSLVITLNEPTSTGVGMMWLIFFNSAQKTFFWGKNNYNRMIIIKIVIVLGVLILLRRVKEIRIKF